MFGNNSLKYKSLLLLIFVFFLNVVNLLKVLFSNHSYKYKKYTVKIFR